MQAYIESHVRYHLTCKVVPYKKNNITKWQKFKVIPKFGPNSNFHFKKMPMGRWVCRFRNFSLKKKKITASPKVEFKNWFFCNVQSYITRWLVIRWNLKFKWVFIQIYSSWIIPQKNNLVLKIYDLDDVPLVSKDNLAEEAQKSDLGHHEVFLV